MVAGMGVPAPGLSQTITSTWSRPRRKGSYGRCSRTSSASARSSDLSPGDATKMRTAVLIRVFRRASGSRSTLSSIPRPCAHLAPDSLGPQIDHGLPRRPRDDPAQHVRVDRAIADGLATDTLARDPARGAPANRTRTAPCRAIHGFASRTRSAPSRAWASTAPVDGRARDRPDRRRSRPSTAPGTTEDPSTLAAECRQVLAATAGALITRTKPSSSRPRRSCRQSSARHPLPAPPPGADLRKRGSQAARQPHEHGSIPPAGW